MGRRGEGGIGRGARERDVVDVVVHLLPRPATLAGRAVGGRDRDRAGDQEERALLLKSYRVRRGALQSMGPGCPGVLTSGHYGC